MNGTNSLAMTASKSLSPVDKAKRYAAFACGDAEIRSGQRLGIGSGTTVKFLIEWLAIKYQNGLLNDIQCVPTSYQTRKWLLEAGIPVQTLETLNELDLTIDGADEADHNLDCIKGGGGCLLQEKIVQTCAKRFVLIGDEGKYCDVLGTNYKSIPIEVAPYGYEPVRRWIIEKEGGEANLRMDSRKCYPVLSENHNYILEWYFPTPITSDQDWRRVHQNLIGIPGVVETGLFLDVVDFAYFSSSSSEGAITTVAPKRKQNGTH